MDKLNNHLSISRYSVYSQINLLVNHSIWKTGRLFKQGSLVSENDSALLIAALTDFQRKLLKTDFKNIIRFSRKYPDWEAARIPALQVSWPYLNVLLEAEADHSQIETFASMVVQQKLSVNELASVLKKKLREKAMPTTSNSIAGREKQSFVEKSKRHTVSVSYSNVPDMAVNHEVIDIFQNAIWQLVMKR